MLLTREQRIGNALTMHWQQHADDLVPCIGKYINAFLISQFLIIALTMIVSALKMRLIIIVNALSLENKTPPQKKHPNTLARTPQPVRSRRKTTKIASNE